MIAIEIPAYVSTTFFFIGDSKIGDSKLREDIS